MIKPWPALALLTIGGALAGWFLFAGLGRLAGADISWWWPKPGSVPEDQLFDIVRSAATVAALIGGLYAFLYAYRKQRVEEAARHRSDAEGVSRRYQDAAEQLGHDKAAVCLAGVYAMARLADEWPEQRQTCVDVLCAYLRMAADHSRRQRPNHEDDNSVTRAITDSIAFRVRREERSNSGPWSDLDFNFSAARFNNWKLNKARFAGKVIFDDAEFAGDCVLEDVSFAKRLIIESPKVLSGHLTLHDLTVDDGPLYVAQLGVSAGASAAVDSIYHTSSQAAWLHMSSFDIQGSFVTAVGNESIPRNALTLFNFNVGPKAEVDVIGPHGPGAAPSDSFRIEALAWLTSEGSRVRFHINDSAQLQAEGWSGSKIGEFATAYRWSGNN